MKYVIRGCNFCIQSVRELTDNLIVHTWNDRVKRLYVDQILLPFNPHLDRSNASLHNK